MDTLSITITISSVIIGILVTFFVAKYYFKKGEKKKSLTPYLQFSSRLFQDIDPTLKDNLIVKYKEIKIENLTQAQFLIANTGDFPIRDIIKNLKLTLPEKNKIFSVSIVHIQPEGRTIDYSIKENKDSNEVIFNIPLLNKGEYFLFKILYQDFVETSEDEIELEDIYSFTITADNLPPKLEFEHLPFNYYEDEIETKYDWTGFWITLVSGIILAGLLLTIFSFQELEQNKYLFDFKKFFNSDTFNFYNVGIIIIGLLGIISFLVLVTGFVIALSEISPDDKPKFKVPSKLRKDRNYSLFD